MAKNKIGQNAGQWYVEVGKLESGSQQRFYLGRVNEVDEDKARIRRHRVREFWKRYILWNRLNGYPVTHAKPRPFWTAGTIEYAKQVGKGAVRIIYEMAGTDPMLLEALDELNRHYEGVVQFVPPENRRAGLVLIGDRHRAAAAAVTTAIREADTLAAGECVHDWLDQFGIYSRSTRTAFDEDTGANAITEWGHNFARQVRFLKAGVKDISLSTLDYAAIEAVVIHFASRPVSAKTGQPIATKYASSLIKAWKQFIKWLPKQTAWRKPEDWEDAFAHRPKKNNAEKASKAIGRVTAYTVAQVQIIFSYATPFERSLFLLALNCGFGAIEISGLLNRDCHVNRAGDSYIKRVRLKNEEGVYGEHWLFPQTVEAVEWSRSRTAAVLKRPLTATDRVVVRSNGERLVKLTAKGNRSNKAANAWQRLTQRIQQDHANFPALSFGKMRKTAGNLIKMFSDGETVAVFHQRSSAVATDDEAEVYTDRDYQKVFVAQRKVYNLLKPMFDAVPHPFDDAKKMYISRSTTDRILELWAEGVKPNDIAKKTGTSRATVYRNRPTIPASS